MNKKNMRFLHVRLSGLLERYESSGVFAIAAPQTLSGVVGLPVPRSSKFFFNRLKLRGAWLVNSTSTIDTEIAQMIEVSIVLQIDYAL